MIAADILCTVLVLSSTVTLCTMYSTILDRYKSMFDVLYDEEELVDRENNRM